MAKSFRWGIIGPGRIAHKFAQSLPFSKNGKLVSVASSSLERAQDFASKYEAENAFGSYQEMLESGTIDAVYVATPHTYHFACSEMALRLGIPVLCEKPLTDNEMDSIRLVKIAKENQVFLMEGMWTVFLPHIQKAFSWIAEGKIGELIHIQADFGYLANYEPKGRLFNPELGGSVSKDVGIYPLALFYKILGKLNNFQVQGHKAITGVDQHVLFQGKGSEKATFQGMVSFLTNSEVEAIIFGSKGKIRIESQWLRATSVTLITESEKTNYKPEVGSFGFQFEADEVEKCVQAGLIESPKWSHTDALSMANYISILEDV
jgi:predicted dehydrogenase